MASVNGKRTRGSIKELTDSLHQDPFYSVKTIRFDLPTGEGAPSIMRGLGEFLGHIIHVLCIHYLCHLKYGSEPFFRL